MVSEKVTKANPVQEKDGKDVEGAAAAAGTSKTTKPDEKTPELSEDDKQLQV